MKCPVCHEAMIVLEWDHVEVDHCPSCKGVWLDQGELELLLETREDKTKILSSFQTCTKQNFKTRKCPICLKKMEQVICGSNSKLYLDRCSKNHGLWFDLRELDLILKAGFFEEYSQVSTWLKGIFLKTANSPR